MWKTALKLIAQLLIARFFKNRMQDVQQHMSNETQHHFSAVKKSMAALVERHAAVFKAQLSADMKRMALSLLGLVFIFFALMCSGLTAIMWLFAAAWNSPHRDVMLGAAIALPVLIAIGILIAIRLSWKKQPLFAQIMVQIENDWRVFKTGLDGATDSSDEANH